MEISSGDLPLLSLTMKGQCLMSPSILRPNNRLASKMVFSGLVWKASFAAPQFAASPTLNEQVRLPRRKRHEGLDVQTFLVSKADPRWCYPMTLVVNDNLNNSFMLDSATQDRDLSSKAEKR